MATHRAPKAHFRRGQAALEFIMTYGWAILVVLVMIGALAYFGITDTSQFTPERCTAGTGLTCTDYRLTGATNLAVELTLENGLGETITVQEITAKTDRGVPDTDCFAGPTNVAPGERFSTTACSITGGSRGVGEKAKVDLQITYVKTQAGIYAHNLTVQIQAKTQ